MVATATLDFQQRAWAGLGLVPDPEIPMVSIVELGMVLSVSALSLESCEVVLLPTFSGCPALDSIESEVRKALVGEGFVAPEVRFNLTHPYTSDRITASGRAKLKAWGIAPPMQKAESELYDDLDFLENTPCPRCNSTDTVFNSTFGPALCRATHYCNACQEAFQSFKPL